MPQGLPVRTHPLSLTATDQSDVLHSCWAVHIHINTVALFPRPKGCPSFAPCTGLACYISLSSGWQKSILANETRKKFEDIQVSHKISKRAGEPGSEREKLS